MGEIIQQMAAITPVTARDILSVLDIPEEEAEEKLRSLWEEKKLTVMETDGIRRYGKAGQYGD